MADGQGQSLGLIKRLSQAVWVEPLLGAMVAVFGIITAGAAYQASIFGGNSNENFFVAQSSLTDSNFFYSKANQDVQSDNDIITQIEVQIALRAPQEAIDALVNALSENALASFDRSSDLDDEYYTAMYADADAYGSRAEQAFNAAKAWDEIGDNYELLGLILAVGLGFAGWAGLMDKESMLRYVFGLMALIVLVVGIAMGANLMGKAMPEMVEPISSIGG